MAQGQLIAAFDFSNVAADEFNDWYDLEHIPERQRVPGFRSLERWIGADNPRQSVAIYDLDTIAVLQSPAYRAIGGENLSPWSKRVTAKCQRLLRFEGEQILPGDALAPANAGGLLLVGMTPAPQFETEFNAWYDTEHVPALSRVPGVLERAPLPRFGRPEIRGALPSDSARNRQRHRLEARQRVDADAGQCAAADQRPGAPRLPQIPAPRLSEVGRLGPPDRARCATNSITGRRSRVAASLSGWRWKRPAPTMPMSPGNRAARP